MYASRLAGSVHKTGMGPLPVRKGGQLVKSVHICLRLFETPANTVAATQERRRYWQLRTGQLPTIVLITNLFQWGKLNLTVMVVPDQTRSKRLNNSESAPPVCTRDNSRRDTLAQRILAGVKVLGKAWHVCPAALARMQAGMGPPRSSAPPLRDVNQDAGAPSPLVDAIPSSL